MRTPADLSALWTIVLAAGDGTRLVPLTRRLYGDDRPKQFARLGGDRTLLQETVARLFPMASAARTVAVVPARYQRLAHDQLRPFPGLDVVVQPRNVGTGPGLMLPLARVLARAPEATVVVTPSDHHYRSPRRLLAGLRAAVAAAGTSPAGVCLLGAEADHPATDLGWIVPGRRVGEGASRTTLVARFAEKPSAGEALSLHHSGGLWNTFVMVGAASRLWALAARHLPRQAALLERYARVVDTDREPAVLREVYEQLDAADFSRDVLAPAEGLGVVALRGAGWSDWGTPERLFRSLEGTPDLEALHERLAEGPRAGRSGDARSRPAYQ